MKGAPLASRSNSAIRGLMFGEEDCGRISGHRLFDLIVRKVLERLFRLRNRPQDIEEIRQRADAVDRRLVLRDRLPDAVVGLRQRDHRDGLRKIGVRRRSGQKSQVIAASLVRDAARRQPRAVALRSRPGTWACRDPPSVTEAPQVQRTEISEGSELTPRSTQKSGLRQERSPLRCARNRQSMS